VEEEGVVHARRLAELHRFLAERPVDAPAALGRKLGPEIFVKRDRSADGGVKPLQVGDGLLADAGNPAAGLEDPGPAAAAGLLLGERLEQIGPRPLGPVGARARRGRRR
jgi:hypothetical protein